MANNEIPNQAKSQDVQAPHDETPVQRFDRWVRREEDERAEALIAQLTEKSLPHLRQMVQSNSEDRRWWGLRGLAAVGHADDVPLVAASLDDSVAANRAVAAMALGALHSRHPQAVRPYLSSLVKHLQDDEGFVRQAAADGLSHCGDDAVDLLAEALQSEESGVRVRAAAALHRIGSMKTALPLYHSLDDPNPLVRHHAFETLDKLGLLSNVLVTR